MSQKTITRSYNLVPCAPLILRDEMSLYRVTTLDEKTEDHVLETYFNDVYHLFLNKLVKVTHESTLSIDDVLKMQSLFDEVIRVKLILQKGE